MSQLLINNYLGDLHRLRQVSGANRESVVREAFKDLLKGWGRSHDLHFVPEHEFITSRKERRYIDGALLHSLRVPFGYWEAKDTKDDLDQEIAKKFKRGYPQTNIIFDDSTKTHNVFGIQIGVAITFLVKRQKAAGCRIFYGRRPEFELREDKLTFLANTGLREAAPDPIRPDARHNWIDTAVTDFQSFLPLVNKETKAAQTTEADNAIFKRFSMGVVTNRDDWVYATTNKEVATKVSHLVSV